MGEVRSLCGVATQGAQSYSAWTTRYKLKLSTNGTTWSIYKETNIKKVWRELKLTFSAINKEFEVNANDRQTEIHLNGEYGHLCVRVARSAAESNSSFTVVYCKFHSF